MAKKQPQRRQKTFDSSVADFLKESKVRPVETPSPPESKPQPTLKQSEKEYERATLYLPPSMKTTLRRWSIDYGVPQSQIAIVALWLLKKAIDDDAIDITTMRTRSDSPRFAYNLDLDELIVDFDDEDE